MSWLRTTLLLAALTALLLIVGQAIGGKTGMFFALVLAIVMNFSAYWFSDKIVLRMYNAQEVTTEQAPELYSIVRDLTQKAQMPMPKIYIVEDPTPNAFATGRNPQNAVVAVTTGILSILNNEELKGVLSHELSHVANRDTLTSAIAATIAGAVAMLANMAQFGMMFGRSSEEGEGPGILGGLLTMLFAPLAASLIQMAVSRSREFAADDSGAHLSHTPLALASALRKLEQANQAMPMQAAEQHPTTAHLFIINPLSSHSLRRLFSTHPPTEERIRRLETIARGEKK